MVDGDISSMDDSYNLLRTSHEIRMIGPGWKERLLSQSGLAHSLSSHSYRSSPIVPFIMLLLFEDTKTMGMKRKVMSMMIKIIQRFFYGILHAYL